MVVPRGLNGATVVNADLETGISVSQAKQGPQEITSLPSETIGLIHLSDGPDRGQNSRGATGC